MASWLKPALDDACENSLGALAEARSVVKGH